MVIEALSEESSVFTLWLRAANQGDGSADVREYQTEQEAYDEEEIEIEKGYDGFAESCVYPLKLKIVDGTKIYWLSHRFVDDKYEEVWIEVK
jgi:hypothetical protein